MKIYSGCIITAGIVFLIACEPSPPQSSAASSGDEISGVVALAQGVTAPESGTLFVIARSEGAGAPLAVKRLPLGPFPMPFRIGSADSPHPGSRFEAPIFLGARVDTDGDVTTKDNDLGAVAPRILAPGDSGIELVLVPNAHPPEVKPIHP